MTSYDLSEARLDRIERKLASIRDPLNHDLVPVFSGEYVFSQMMISDIHDASLGDSLDFYAGSDWKVFIPTYFYQKNTLNNFVLERLHGLQQQAENVCLPAMDWTFKKTKKLMAKKYYWFEPNSLGAQYLGSDNLDNTFGTYLKRHCLARFHIEALRVV